MAREAKAPANEQGTHGEREWFTRRKKSICRFLRAWHCLGLAATICVSFQLNDSFRMKPDELERQMDRRQGSGEDSDRDGGVGRHRQYWSDRPSPANRRDCAATQRVVPHRRSLRRTGGHRRAGESLMDSNSPTQFHSIRTSGSISPLTAGACCIALPRLRRKRFLP